MKPTVVLGLQWGDEGKGKLVDHLSEQHDVIVRFNGGANAGHTIYHEGKKHAVHQIPAGIFHNKSLVIANGCVVDAVKLMEEIEYFKSLGVSDIKLRISDRAHLVLPRHVLADEDQESRRSTKIGTTLSGNGPAYSEKAGRQGLRVGDGLKLRGSELVDLLEVTGIFNSSNRKMRPMTYDLIQALEYLRPYVCDTVDYLHHMSQEQRRILLAGAHGTMLDIEHGDYPMVTSSNVCIGGAMQGTGLSFSEGAEVIGVVRPYATRVGSGEMRGELNEDQMSRLREKGQEYGTTTGRPRRLSWLDIDQLQRHVKINGVTSLALMKTDTVAGETIETIGGSGDRRFQWDEVMEDSEIFRVSDDLMDYLGHIETESGVPVKYVSYGPDRSSLLVR